MSFPGDNKMWVEQKRTGIGKTRIMLTLICVGQPIYKISYRQIEQTNHRTHRLSTNILSAIRALPSNQNEQRFQSMDEASASVLSSAHTTTSEETATTSESSQFQESLPSVVTTTTTADDDTVTETAEANWKQKERIGRAACTQLSYDFGYKRIVGATQLHAWIKSTDVEMRTGNMETVLKKKHKGRASYTDLITRDHPVLLHQLYRYAASICGDTASFEELAISMNAQSAVQNPDLPQLHLTRHTLRRWFKKYCGKERLTTDHLRARIEYSQHVLRLLQEGENIAYLDEKWFYIMSRRKK